MYIGKPKGFVRSIVPFRILQWEGDIYVVGFYNLLASKSGLI